jgi:xanthosine utilization system XapX-like protein
MLTGRRLFVGEHDVAIAHAIIHGEPVAPATHRREVTPELQLVVQRLLHKSPSQRYASAAAVVADLDALERGEATASSSTRRPAFALAVSRRPLATIVLAVIGIIVVALGARLLRRDGSSAEDVVIQSLHRRRLSRMEGRRRRHRRTCAVRPGPPATSHSGVTTHSPVDQGVLNVRTMERHAWHRWCRRRWSGGRDHFSFPDPQA